VFVGEYESVLLIPPKPTSFTSVLFQYIANSTLEEETVFYVVAENAN